MSLFEQPAPPQEPPAPTGLPASGVVLRPVRDDDAPFLFDLYASARRGELAAAGLTREQEDAFLRMQFAAQTQYYDANFADDDSSVIEVNGRPAGRIYVGRRKDEIYLIDFAMMPEHRRKGLGAALIEDLLDESRRTGKPVRIHVEKFNPAMRLYERLGFYTIADHGLHYLMEWTFRGVSED